MLATTLRRNRRHGAFHQLQQRLLHALTRYVAGDGWVFGFARDLVDLVDIDDAALRAFHVVFRCLQQLEDDVFDIFTHIARFGQRGSIRHGERHIQNARQRLRQQSLTATGWTDQQDVGLLQLDVARLLRVVQAFVVVVHRHRQNPLGHGLTNHIVIQHFADFFWRWHTVRGFQACGLGFLADDVHAEFYAFVADKDRRTCNQLADLMLAFTAEAAVKGVLAVTTTGIR